MGRSLPLPVIIMTAVQFTMMNLNDSIIFALNILGDCNQMLHDFWVSELYDEDDDPITNVWNDATLAMIEKDVMMQIEAN